MIKQFKYLNLLTMLYMTIKITTVMLIYKIIKIGSFSGSASTLIIPLWFIIGDVIAEVYGYKVAKNVVWAALFCQFFFALICVIFVNLPSPPSWPQQALYSQLFNKLPRVTLSSFFAITCGAFINAYAISKWKILLRGKYFWLRSLAASSVGELVFIVIAYLAEFLGVVPLMNIIHLIAVGYLVKLIINPLLVFPSAMLANFLKRHEGIDVYDNDVNYNPLSINILAINLSR